MIRHSGLQAFAYGTTPAIVPTADRPQPVSIGKMGCRAGALIGAAALMAGLSATAHAADDNDGLLKQAIGGPDGLTITGGVRARVEGIDGQFRPGKAEDDVMFSLKTTLAVDYDGGPFRIGGELWDARAYGEHDNSSAGTTEVNAMELVQAYVGLDFKTGAKGEARLTAGRFTMNIGSRRLIARQQFRNSTNAYTGVNFVWKGGNGDQIIALWSMPQQRLPDDTQGIQDNKVVWDRESTDLQLWGAHLTKAHVFGGVLEVYGFGLDERDSPTVLTKNRHLFTPGARLFRKPKAGHFDYDVEGAYQFGSTRLTTSASDMNDVPVSAYLIHAEAGTTFKSSWQPRLSFDFDVASGDKAGSKTYNRFDTLYGARRFDFGPTGLYGAVGRSNLLSGGVRVEAKPDKKSDMMFMYRALWLASRTDSFASTSVRDAKGNSGNFAGNQFDLRYRRTLVPNVLHFDTGVAYLAKGRFLKDAPNAPQTGDTKYGYFDMYFDF
ncbi:alginate export family protein [Novosphingobium sp. BL-8A]|uniref:alginate export family protein n=1 Tax=Novosphingobium sp. BL-8A TaxID=3127639 RepID=UPI0037571E39